MLSTADETLLATEVDHMGRDRNMMKYVVMANPDPMKPGRWNVGIELRMPRHLAMSALGCGTNTRGVAVCSDLLCYLVLHQFLDRMFTDQRRRRSPHFCWKKRSLHSSDFIIPEQNSKQDSMKPKMNVGRATNKLMVCFANRKYFLSIGQLVLHATQLL